MRQIKLIIHNVRSAHNVGSLLRTADGLGITQVIISGYSPFPKQKPEERLPHIADKINFQIHKTALGAEESVDWLKINDLNNQLAKLKKAGFVLAALEQADNSVRLEEFQPPDKIALLVGNELEGVENTVIELMDICLEIPMRGQKESFNVAVAGAIGLYHLVSA